MIAPEWPVRFGLDEYESEDQLVGDVSDTIFLDVWEEELEETEGLAIDEDGRRFRVTISVNLEPWDSDGSRS